MGGDVRGEVTWEVGMLYDGDVALGGILSVGLTADEKTLSSKQMQHERETKE